MAAAYTAHILIAMREHFKLKPPNYNNLMLTSLPQANLLLLIENIRYTWLRHALIHFFQENHDDARSSRHF